MTHTYLKTLINNKKLRERLLHIKWSRDPKVGFLKVWLDGKNMYKYNGITMVSSNPVFFKYGIYRNDLQFYKNMIAEDKKWKNVPEHPTPEFWVKFYS